MDRFEVLGERGLDRRLVLQHGAQAFGLFFKGREVVLLAVQRVPHLFKRRQSRRHAALGGARGEIGRSGARVAIGLVKPGERFGGPGMGVGELAHVALVEIGALQDGVRRGRREVGDELAVAFGGEFAHVDVERLGQRQQNAGGDRTLIAFEQVQIAWRDA